MPRHTPYLRNLLIARTEWMEERVMEGARRLGYDRITPAMSRLFAHLGRRAVGVSELARQMAISRQAVHQLALEAQSLGLVELVESTEDRRVKLLRFTSAGWVMSDHAAQALEEIEAELARRIGSHDLEALRRILAKDWAGEPPS
jgi:DNA-binding MarR family transcriptional regulator